MISEATFRGRSRELSFGANAYVGWGYRWLVASATAGSLALTMPDARSLRLGAPVQVIFNNGANAFAVKDNAGGTLVASLAVGDAAFLDLLENTTAAGVWVVEPRTKLS